MKRIYKVCVLVVLIDLLLYLLLFHCGIILPFINPSVEVYNKSFTSYPRDTMQKVVWALFHFTAIPIAKLFSLNEKYLFLLIIQDVWVILLVNYIFFRKKRNSWIKNPPNDESN
jgi:hypothetical protein